MTRWKWSAPSSACIRWRWKMRSIPIRCPRSKCSANICSSSRAPRRPPRAKPSPMARRRFSSGPISLSACASDRAGPTIRCASGWRPMPSGCRKGRTLSRTPSSISSSTATSRSSMRSKPLCRPWKSGRSKPSPSHRPSAASSACAASCGGSSGSSGRWKKSASGLPPMNCRRSITRLTSGSAMCSTMSGARWCACTG